MFYVKIRKDDVSVKAEITPDNVYTECAGCGHEIPIDLEEMLKDDACDLTATKVFCDACSRIIHRNDKKNATLKPEIPF